MDTATKKAIFTIAATSLVFAAIGAFIGGGVGFLLGLFLPGYYRSLYLGGEDPTFNSVQVGLGLGVSQGVIGGLLLGTVVGVAILFIQSRKPA